MITELLNIDTDFSEDEFYGYIDNIFVKLFTGVMLQNIDDIKHFLSDKIINEYQNRIDLSKKNKRIEMFNELNVASSSITNIDIQQDKITIQVKLTAKYLHYIINMDNKEIISGNKNVRETKSYYLTFTKKREANKQRIIKKCPTCGNSLNVNNSGICPFCHQYYNLDDHDYILDTLDEI